MAHYQPVVEENHYHSDDARDDSSSALTMIILLLAVLLVAGFALFAFRAYPFNGNVLGAGTPSRVQVDVNGAGTPAGTTGIGTTK